MYVFIIEYMHDNDYGSSVRTQSIMYDDGSIYCVDI